MTLKDYTNYVLLFDKLFGQSNLPDRVFLSFASIREQIFNRSLIALLGDEQYAEFVNLFHEKIGYAGTAKYITPDMINLNNGEIFLATLAEFCEPLIGKEKSKGGQDAAKA